MKRWALVVLLGCLHLFLCSSSTLQRCRKSTKCVGGLEDPITASYFHDYALHKYAGYSPMMNHLRHKVPTRSEKNTRLLDFHGDAMYCARNYSCLSRSILCRPYAGDVAESMTYQRNKLPSESRAQFKHRKKTLQQQGWLPSSAMPIDANGDKCANFVVGRSSADDSAFNSTATASKIRNFFWVHIPKCGSTFEVSLYLWACPAVAYLATDAMDDDMTGRRASESSFSSGTCSFIKTFFTHNTQQGKVWCDASDARKRPHEPLTRQHLGRAMVLVRNPRQRLVSAFKNHLHCFGLQSREKLNAAVNASLLQDSSRKGQLRALELFANWPDVQGCQTKMLSGTDCCYPSERLKGVDWGEKLREATARLLDKQQVPFFGITDLYAPSICLFHAMHGAKLWDVELHNIHKTSSSTQTNKLDLLRHEAPSATSGGAPNWDFEGFNISDPLDQQLFDVALVEFKRRLIQYRDRVEPCCRDHGCAEYFAQVLKAATAAR